MFLRAAFATGDTQIHILGTPGGPKGAAAAAAEAAEAAGKAGAACDGSTTASESASQSKNDGKQAQPPKRAVSRTGSTSMTPNQAVVTALLLRQCGVGAGAMQRLRREGLSSCASLLVLDLSHNPLGSEGAQRHAVGVSKERKEEAWLEERIRKSRNPQRVM